MKNVKENRCLRSDPGGEPGPWPLQRWGRTGQPCGHCSWLGDRSASGTWARPVLSAPELLRPRRGMLEFGFTPAGSTHGGSTAATASSNTGAPTHTAASCPCPLHCRDLPCVQRLRYPRGWSCCHRQWQMLSQPPRPRDPSSALGPAIAPCFWAGSRINSL